jgi:hypothetical protein
MSNAIVIENEKQGNPESEWGLSGGASTEIEGFTADISYNIGQTVEFKIDTVASAYRIDIYRLGYYNGDGARLVASIDHAGSVVQPDPLTDSTTGLVDAGNWSVTDTWSVPDDAVSGVYIAKLVREDSAAGENHIPFIVRNDGSTSDIVFKTSDETWQAYNSWGGDSLYEGGDVAVSYNRPITTAYGDALSPPRPWNFVFGEEYPAIRWLEANGFDVSYIAGVDTARSGESLLDHRLFLSVGHDEYWSAEQRTAVEAARDAGVNLAFWSGNEVFWKTRWGDSLDDSATPYRTLISYKETNHDAKVDPSPVWTGMWRDARFSNGTEVLIPENALTGTLYMVDYDRATPLNPLLVSSDYASLPIWRNTSIAQLQPGESVSFPDLIGYEWDVNYDNGYAPPTLIELSSTTLSSSVVLQDIYAKTVAPGTATHSLTMYRAESGALVFGAGTVMWPWGLDAEHASGPPGSNTNPQAYTDIQQAMVNLFADMGIAPASLQDGLVDGFASRDTGAPAIAAAAWPATFNYLQGYPLTVAGTASDAEGHLAGVVVSGDGGNTWHRAAGTTGWTASVVVAGGGAGQVLMKSFDASFNLSPTISLSVNQPYAVTGTLQDFSVAQGWSNTEYRRFFADINGDGVKDLLGFGQEATLGFFGGGDAGNGGFATPDVINVHLNDFAAAQGYGVDAPRGVDYLGDFIGNGGRVATVWGQGTAGIVYHTPTAANATTVTFSEQVAIYAEFGPSTGWTSEHTLDVGFVSDSDSYGSVFGFGTSGLLVGRSAFSPTAAVAASLVGGSAAFGNAAGWNETTDIRAVRDWSGTEIDLNKDGITDVVAVGKQGTVYAFGQLTPDGAGGSVYSLGPTFVAKNNALGAGSDFGSEQGWSKAATPRFIADVNNDGYVDIVGFGEAGIWVSEGQAPAADGSGAFGQAHLAVADYGNSTGWGSTDHVRNLGDMNGDGVLDIIGFGDASTFVALGHIDQASGHVSWTLDAMLNDFAIAEGWNSQVHFRDVVDIDGDGRTDIIAAGDFNTRVTTSASLA